MRGTVKWFDQLKGYGFICPDGASGERDENFFFHYSDVERRPDEGRLSLAGGELVEFDVGEHRGRPSAVRVRRV